MPSRLRVLGALALLFTLASCGDVAPVDDARVSPPTSLIAVDVAAPVFTDEQVRYLAAQAELDAARAAFLQGAAAARAAVPDQLRRIMWCEAGRYLGLERYTTNYAAKTHGYDGASGGAQILGSTWVAWAREIGVDVARWPRAFLAPDFVQDTVATHGYRTRGSTPWNPSAYCWR